MDRSRLVGVGFVAVGVVLLASVGVWFSFLDTPAPTETELNATTPDPTVSTAPSEFRMTVDVRSRSLEDGTEQANWSAGVMYDAESQARLGWLSTRGAGDNISITHFQRYSDNRTHNYIEYHNADQEQFDRRVGSIRDDLDQETETLRVDNASRTYKYYREGDRSEFDVVAEQVPPLGFIHLIPFEREGSTTYKGEQVETYVPVDGWTETTRSATDDGADTYLSNTSGVVYVSEESGTIVFVDVSVTSQRTDARAGRWFGDGGSRTHIRLSVSEDVDDELRSEWTTESPFDET